MKSVTDVLSQAGNTSLTEHKTISAENMNIPLHGFNLLVSRRCSYPEGINHSTQGVRLLRK